MLVRYCTVGTFSFHLHLMTNLQSPVNKFVGTEKAIAVATILYQSTSFAQKADFTFKIPTEMCAWKDSH